MPMDWIMPNGPALLWVVVSTLCMYFTLVLIARWSGVRSFAEMSPVDIAVTIGLGSLLATVAVSKNPPLSQGLAALVTLYGVQWIISRLRRRFAGVEKTTDNAPILLMGEGGTMKPVNMRIARVTENDLRTHLRAANVADVATVRAMVMEGTGAINVLHGADGRLDKHAWILSSVRDYSAGDE